MGNVQVHEVCEFWKFVTGGRHLVYKLIKWNIVAFKRVLNQGHVQKCLSVNWHLTQPENLTEANIPSTNMPASYLKVKVKLYDWIKFKDTRVLYQGHDQ